MAEKLRMIKNEGKVRNVIKKDDSGGHSERHGRSRRNKMRSDEWEEGRGGGR